MYHLCRGTFVFWGFIYSMSKRYNFIFLIFISLLILNSCFDGSGSGFALNSNPESTPTQTSTPIIPLNNGSANFTLRGTITYDYVQATDGISAPGPKLDYVHMTARPARRVVVQALEGGFAVSQTTTNDLGHYVLQVPTGKVVNIRVRLWALASSYLPDGISPDNCSGASWDIRIVDNTQSKGSYVFDGVTQFSSNSDFANLHAPLSFSGNTYKVRSAAPFALLDTAVSVLELACQGRRNIAFPLLYINWSPNNINITGDKSTGNISTSHFITENGVSNLYILGKENVDTDEFDDHVIAHEFGHYLENTLFRSDSIGGTHGQGDSLDPRVAFSEGFGNAVSAMTFNNPVYVDTSGDSQSNGFPILINSAPTGDSRGIYSEKSVQYLLWNLYENRDFLPNNGSFDRIFNVLANFQKTTPAFTTLQSFSAYYNQSYGGSSENLQSLWSSDLDLPYNALCTSGFCSGAGDVADPFDSGNLIGSYIGTGGASLRKYPQGTGGGVFSNLFWSLYRTLVSGLNFGNAHDQINLGNYSKPVNKFGAVRWYKLIGTGNFETVSISNLGGGVLCTSDVLDVYVYYRGTIIALNKDSSGSTAGCPSVSFSTIPGETYLITVNAFTGNGNVQVPSWNVTVSPKPLPPITVESVDDIPSSILANLDQNLNFDIGTHKECSELRTKIRGIEGVLVSGEVEKNQTLIPQSRHYKHGVKAKLLPGKAGYVVVDVVCVNDGVVHTFSQPFPLKTKGSGFKMTSAKVGQDERGDPIVYLKSEGP